MSIKIDDNTSIGLPLRNLIGLVAAVVVGAWFAFGVIERLQMDVERLRIDTEKLKDSVRANIGKLNGNH